MLRGSCRRGVGFVVQVQSTTHGLLFPSLSIGMLLCLAGEEVRMSRQTAPVDILAVLQTYLTGERALRETPPLLVLSMANMYNEGNEDFWVDCRVYWSSLEVDLRGCMVAPGTRQRAPLLHPLGSSAACSMRSSMQAAGRRRARWASR